MVFTLSITDVRRKSDLDDYTGGVRATVPLQVTDRDHTPAPAGLNQGTSMLTEFSFDAACGATADTTVGSTCATTTSADAVVPGAVKESKRAVWSLASCASTTAVPTAIPRHRPTTPSSRCRESCAVSAR